MRRLAILGVASVTTLAIATPALTVAATAATDGSSDRSTHVASVVAKKKPSIKLKRSAKGVQPGIGKEKITAIVNGTTTRSSTCKFLTLLPTATTSPIGSWPSTSPSSMVGT